MTGVETLAFRRLASKILECLPTPGKMLANPQYANPYAIKTKKGFKQLEPD